MGRFWAGFAAGVVVVAGVVAIAWIGGVLAFVWPFGRTDSPVAQVDPQIDEALDGGAASDGTGRGRRRRGRRGAAGSGAIAERDDVREERPARAPRGEATTGDEIGPSSRSIDMEGGGGEQQLSDAQVDAGFDRAFPRMRRCLALAAGDEPVRGRVMFTVRIAPSGRPSAVRLSGPAAVTTGESGDCLRGAARGISWPSFDGPEMTVRWPLTLD